MAFAERTETKTTLLPLLHKQVGNDELKPPPAGSAMTKKGAYAAVSYMASAARNGSLRIPSWLGAASSPPMSVQPRQMSNKKLPCDGGVWVRCSLIMALKIKLLLLNTSKPSPNSVHVLCLYEEPRRLELNTVLLLMFNKAALSSYNFPCANVITLFQIMCSCTLLYALRRWKIISFTVGGESQSISVGRSMILVPFKTLVKTLPLALSYLFYMVVTMESVRGINLPMYTTLRRTTVAFTMIAEYLLTGQTHSPFVVASVGMIILGAVVAGSRDLSFDTYSYAVVFVANICTALYLAFIARIGVICGPLLLLWITIRGDVETTLNFRYLFSFGFQCVMLLSCIMAFLINYFVFLNTTLNSALTQTVCVTWLHGILLVCLLQASWEIRYQDEAAFYALESSLIYKKECIG
uniref:Sugar phosphate transporter domain-containing protein n=1 Tax=Cucumis melo TaxID=3656 RepID=A0A9I9EBU3_CUCME